MRTESERPQAILKVVPTHLDFGKLEKDKLKKGEGKATLIIYNRGNRSLIGEILPQVDWVQIEPRKFRLLPEECSEHEVRMTGLSPTVWTTHQFGSDFIALVTSNGGSETVSGFYYMEKTAVMKRENAHPLKFRTFAYALTALGMLFGMIVGLSGFLRNTDSAMRTEEAEAIITSIVETMEAEQTAAAPSPTPIFGYGDDASFNATAAAYGLSLISPMNAAQPTFTPWPAGKYPSPQQFLFTYYSLLNEKNYNDAYWLLSEKMQVSCCYGGGGTPIENYRALMSGIRSFDLVSAYLQAEEMNPAEVRFQLTQYNDDGTQSDSVLTAYIIDDEERNTLLIDEIK